MSTKEFHYQEMIKKIDQYMIENDESMQRNIYYEFDSVVITFYGQNGIGIRVRYDTGLVYPSNQMDNYFEFTYIDDDYYAIPLEIFEKHSHWYAEYVVPFSVLHEMK